MRRVRMPYKRFSPISDTFLVTPFGSVFRQIEFFNSHRRFHSLWNGPFELLTWHFDRLLNPVRQRDFRIRVKEEVRLDEPVVPISHLHHSSSEQTDATNPRMDVRLKTPPDERYPRSEFLRIGRNINHHKTRFLLR